MPMAVRSKRSRRSCRRSGCRSANRFERCTDGGTYRGRSRPDAVGAPGPRCERRLPRSRDPGPATRIDPAPTERTAPVGTGRRDDGHQPLARRRRGHLVSHAPTPRCFAAAITAAIDDPDVGIGLASRMRAQPAFIAAASELYGLAPSATAEILRDEDAPMTQVVAILGELCDYDDNVVLAAWRGVDLDVPRIAASRRNGGTSQGSPASAEPTSAPPTNSSPCCPRRSPRRPRPPLFEHLTTPVDLAELTMETTKP